MSNQEIEQVREVLQRYITGTYQADVEMLSSVFHPQAHMTGYLGDTLLLGTPQPFLDDMVSQPSMASTGAPYHAEIRELNVTGRIASAIVYETGFRGDGVLEDHFQLLLENGRWSIISKNFTTL